jgi:hypothetical protein
MRRDPDNPVLVGALGALLLAGLIGGMLLWATRRRMIAAERDLAGKTAELQALVQRTPAPTSENAAALGAALTRMREALTAVRARVGVAPAPGALSANRTDAFFALAAFAERMRARAAADQVAVGPGERFGFAAFAREGPTPAAIPLLARQQRWLEALLPLLFAAGPEEFLGARRSVGTGVESTGGDPDVFNYDRRFSMREADGAARVAFRLEFAGQTQALRRFLNSVASGSLPATIRAVEVESAAKPEGADGRNGFTKAGGAEGKRDGIRAPEWLVAQNRSRFAVTIEVLDAPEIPSAAGGGESR